MKIPTNNDNDQDYRTTDLGCATALVVVGINLLELDRSNPRRVVFCFKNDRTLAVSSDSYWNGGLHVDAKSYFEALKWLKSRVYNG